MSGDVYYIKLALLKMVLNIHHTLGSSIVRYLLKGEYFQDTPYLDEVLMKMILT